MSWQDRYVKNLIITTGDEETFTLFTLPSFIKEVEYNGTDFSFVEIDGELIKKRTIKGRSFPLEFYFIGDDHIEDAKSFEFSASHPSPWIIQHPYYDNLLVQVLSIKFDDSDLNLTKVTCTARETLTDNGFTSTSNPIDIVQLKKIELDSLLAAEPIISPSIVEVNNVKFVTEKNYKEGVKIIQNPIDAENYFNAFNKANTYVDTIVATPILAIQSLINIITLPAQFEANVKDRIEVLINQFNNLRQTLFGINTVPASQLYQIQGAGILSAMSLAAISPLAGNYTNAGNAIQIANQINSAYQQFIKDVDALQGINGGNPSFFVPGFNIMITLANLIFTTTGNLFEIALAGRKELSFVLTEDSNIILLTHRFYKLDKFDNNIEEFINNNGLNENEIGLGLPKGKTVLYYV